MRSWREEEHQIKRNHVKFSAQLEENSSLGDTSGARNRMCAGFAMMCFIISWNYTENKGSVTSGKTQHSLESCKGLTVSFDLTFFFLFGLTFFLGSILISSSQPMVHHPIEVKLPFHRVHISDILHIIFIIVATFQLWNDNKNNFMVGRAPQHEPQCPFVTRELNWGPA